MTPQFARTWLFVPGDRPERFSKAVGSGADAVVVDLEDAVSQARKEFARSAVIAALDAGAKIAVRVNSYETDDFELDIAALSGSSARPSAVVLAKAESGEGISSVAEQLGCPVLPLIETAAGLLRAEELALVPRVVRLGFGAVDFSLDIESGPEADVLAYARSHLVAVSRAARRAGVIDSPSIEIDKPEEVFAAAQMARRFGMGGKFCIHPAQLPSVARAFSPSAGQLLWARNVLEAASDTTAGAMSVGGQMVDRAVVDHARRLLTTSKEGI